MTVADQISLPVLLLFPLTALVELMRPARPFPKIPWWHALGFSLFVYVGLLSLAIVAVLPTDWLAAHSLFDLSGLGLVPGILVGHLLLTLAMYCWHRATHTFDILWRGFHQIHHSPRHLNVYVAGVNHPLDLSVYIVLPYLVGLFVLGLSPVQATVLSSIGAFNAFLQHANIHTPRWLALFFQRPEAHCIHHQRGVHGYNYSDLPLWDWVFGTLRNPATWEGETGFDPPADQRYGAMLAFVDVNRPELGKGSFGQKAEQAFKKDFPVEKSA
jgi:sterol desaturase/sphingolipid hydroxylase (fatty acid hydroxylase superfamily)